MRWRRHPRAVEERDAAGLPPDLRDLWTSTTQTHLEIGPEARSLVQFKRLNLQGDWPMQRPFQVIFCRNVMIYFDQPTKERLVERLARQLVPGGFLYIGHSERVSGAGERCSNLSAPRFTKGDDGEHPRSHHR
jgi:chemotaxis protein methyltransferase CheR